MNEKGILVYFTDGVTSDSTIVLGKTVKKTRVHKASLRESLKEIAIPEDSIMPALPMFKQSDTLRVLADGREVKQSDMSKLYKIKVDNKKRVDDIIKKLRSLPEVLYAEPDGIAVPCVAPTDNSYSLQWDMKNPSINGADIHAEAAWDIYTGNSNSIIAIIDYGVDITHPDLNDKIAGGDIGYAGSHGTSVAGIAAAESNNSQGVAGVDWNARILPKRIDTGGDAVIYQAIVDAVDYSPNVNVLNNSYALLYPDSTVGRSSTTVRQAVAYAYKNNRVFVASTHNYQLTQPDVVAYPAGFDNVIAVGSTDWRDIIASSSAHGNYIDVCAPGVNIFSTVHDPLRLYNYESGTSMAAPHVSGIASLLKGYNPNLANDDIENIIKLSADKTPNMTENFDNTYGYGRVNAERALDYLRLPYALAQQTTTGGTVINTSSEYVALFIGASNLATANYLVKKIEVQKTVALLGNVYNVVGAWGRGTFTAGWGASSPNFGEGFCEVVPGSLTGTSMTLRTYVYQIWSIAGYYLGYYPTAPANVTFAYSVLGLEKPTLSGPSQICDQGTYTINNLPLNSIINWSYSSNLNLSSGEGTNTATFIANGTNSSSAFVKATININGEIFELTKNISRIGNEVAMIGVFDYYTGYQLGAPYNLSTRYYIRAMLNDPPSGSSNYRWTVTPPPGSELSLMIYIGQSILFNTSFEGSYRFQLRYLGGCGWSTTSKDIYLGGGINSFSMYPNPATEVLTIELNEEVIPEMRMFTTSNVDYQIQLWNEYSGLVRTINTNEKVKQISLQGLSKGMYFVHLIKNEKTLQKQILIVK